MDPDKSTPAKTALTLSSPDFAQGTAIPSSYTCKGQNFNPPLHIVGTPPRTLSLALIMHDPDSVNGDFVHWLMWDIPPSTKAITANSVPVGAVQGANGSGQPKYMGPCPPAGTGTHRYMFELYALDDLVNLPPGSNRAELEKTMENHVLAKTTLTGLFSAD